MLNWWLPGRNNVQIKNILIPGKEAEIGQKETIHP